LDNNTNVTDVIVGPKTFTRQDHQSVVGGPTAMIMVPPRHYCIIENPVVREDGVVARDKNGQVRLRHSDQEIRFESPDPFPLYPGESLVGKVTPLQVVAPNTAIRLRAIRDYKEYKAGDEWLF
jgi:major vault protein